MARDPAHLIREEFLQSRAYHVPSAQGLIKLDAMENPFSLPAALQDELGELLRATALNRYPDASAIELKRELRAAFDIDESHAIMLGNGSDEIIQVIATALARPGAALLTPEPSFSMYRVIAAQCAMRFVGVPLTSTFQLDRAAMLRTIEREQPALIFLACPNNPTGNLFDADVVEEIVAAASGLVVIDEAYFPFAQHTFAGQLANYPNLLIMRTLSKMGLAGLRLGYIFGNPAWLEEFEKVRLPYNINVLTQVVGGFALRQKPVFDQQAQILIEQRQRLIGELQTIAGLETFPSAANFLLLKFPQDASQLHGNLRERGVLVKNLDADGGALRGCLRVTVGSEVENQAFLNALYDCLDRSVD